MRTLISLLFAGIFAITSVVPIADAHTIRIRKGRSRGYSFEHKNISSQYRTTPTVYSPQASVYYYSLYPQVGYTYAEHPKPWYYRYDTTSPSSGIEQGRYYYSSQYKQGYTFMYSPKPWYYYHLPSVAVRTSPSHPRYPINHPDMICVEMHGVYQCTNNRTVVPYTSYPWCTARDIVIGNQVWASCNALDTNKGSSSRSGWFFAGDTQSTFESYNAANAVLEWAGWQRRTKSWKIGPCAESYRLPTRSDWITLQSYANANKKSIANIINLPLNAGYIATRNSYGDIAIDGRLSVGASYWTSTHYNQSPIVMRIGSRYLWYHTNGTEFGYVNKGYEWIDTDTGLSLINSTAGELANVRCIKK